MIIQYKNLDELKRSETNIVKGFSEKYGQRIERYFPEEDAELIVHIKDYKQTGSKVKYSIHIRAGRVKVLSADASGWDISKTMKAAFAKLEKELNKKFKR